MDKKKEFKKLVDFLGNQTFGEYAALDLPDDVDLIIVCENAGGGLRPLNMLLPHQLYKKDLIALEKELAKKCTSFGEIVVVPVRSSEYITVSEYKWS